MTHVPATPQHQGPYINFSFEALVPNHKAEAFAAAINRALRAGDALELHSYTYATSPELKAAGFYGILTDALVREGITTLDQLCDHSEADLLELTAKNQEFEPCHIGQIMQSLLWLNPPRVLKGETPFAEAIESLRLPPGVRGPLREAGIRTLMQLQELVHLRERDPEILAKRGIQLDHGQFAIAIAALARQSSSPNTT